MGIICFTFSVLVSSNYKVITDEEKIESNINLIFFNINQRVYWKDIYSLELCYFINPSVVTNLKIKAPTEILYAFRKYKKDTLVITSFNFFPPKLLNILFSRIPKNTSTYLDLDIKNRIIRRYGPEVVEKFDNIGKKAYETVPKNNLLTLNTITSFLKVFLLILSGMYTYYFVTGDLNGGMNEFFLLVVVAFFASIAYFIYWWLFGGNASS
jgi:hypothetical protein